MTDRSVTVVLCNKTEETLILTDVALNQAKWQEDHYPPKVVYSDEEVSWTCLPLDDSSNISGSVRFNLLKKVSSFFIEWEQQAELQSGYGYSVPAGFTIDKSGGTGKRATVEFVLSSSSVFQTEMF